MTAIRTAGVADLAALSAIAADSLDLDPEDARDLPDMLWPADRGTERLRLVATERRALIGGLIGSVQGESAYVDLLVVGPESRRRGAGDRLLAAFEDAARTSGATRLHVGADLRPYAWPGVDVRYTAALCLFLRAGYRRTEIVYDMDVDPWSVEPADARERALETSGVVVRRALLADRHRLEEYALGWSEVWSREIALAVDRGEPTAFLAERGDRLLGFAAWGVHRRGLYGPIATDPAARGLGIGDALSRRCLMDMAAGGVDRARIGWVAEEAIPFYSRTVGARLGRCYWILEKAA